MPQYAWPELDRGMWHLLTDVRSKPNEASRKGPDRNVALEELQQEGWTITGPYANRISINLKINQKVYGYGLVSTMH
jgi:hypothetical protein